MRDPCGRAFISRAVKGSKTKRRVPTRDPPFIFKLAAKPFAQPPANRSVARPYRRGLRGLRLGDAHVSDEFVFPDLVDHELQRHSRSPRVEVDGLIDCAVLLLETQVVYVERHGELILLNIRAAELDHEIADLRAIALPGERELEIIALAHPAELIDLVVIAGDQGAEFGAGHVEIVPR